MQNPLDGLVDFGFRGRGTYKLKRSELETIDFGRPIARRVGESSAEPLEHAAPTEQATPAKSRAIKSICPSCPGKAIWPFAAGAGHSRR